MWGLWSKQYWRSGSHEHVIPAARQEYHRGFQNRAWKLCSIDINRLKKSNQMQQYADIYLLLNYSTCFGRPSRPSSGVHKTVGAASGTDHTVWGKSFFKVLIWSRLSKRLQSPYLITFEQVSSDVLIWSRLSKLLQTSLFGHV
jgi:hypothetical protein